MDVKLLVFFVVITVLLVTIYFKLCDLLNALQALRTQLGNIEKNIIGDNDDPEAIMLKPSVKELISDGCLRIENGLTRIRYGLFGERAPAIDHVNVLDTLVQINLKTEKQKL